MLLQDRSQRCMSVFSQTACRGALDHAAPGRFVRAGSFAAAIYSMCNAQWCPVLILNRLAVWHELQDLAPSCACLRLQRRHLDAHVFDEEPNVKAVCIPSVCAISTESSLTSLCEARSQMNTMSCCRLVALRSNMLVLHTLLVGMLCESPIHADCLLPANRDRELPAKSCLITRDCAIDDVQAA